MRNCIEICTHQIHFSTHAPDCNTDVNQGYTLPGPWANYHLTVYCEDKRRGRSFGVPWRKSRIINVVIIIIIIILHGIKASKIEPFIEPIIIPISVYLYNTTGVQHNCRIRQKVRLGGLLYADI